MDEHAADLGNFLTLDDRGKMLPGYLSKIAQALMQEQQGMIEELGHLTRSIDHIKDVVATQQSYAGVSSLVVPVQICDLAEDALRMNGGALARHQVTVVKEFAQVPVVRLDRTRVLQILVNLIRPWLRAAQLRAGGQADGRHPHGPQRRPRQGRDLHARTSNRYSVRRAMNTLQNRHILLVDDMPSIHEDFRKILAARPAARDLDDVEAALFGQTAPLSVDGFELDSAYQGHEGVAKVEASVQAGRPYAMAFVDMRMPPGWDGVETIERLWRVDPQVQIVILADVTARVVPARRHDHLAPHHR